MLLMMTFLPFIVMAQKDNTLSDLKLPDLLISENGKRVQNSKE